MFLLILIDSQQLGKSISIQIPNTNSTMVVHMAHLGHVGVWFGKCYWMFPNSILSLNGLSLNFYFFYIFTITIFICLTLPLFSFLFSRWQYLNCGPAPETRQAISNEVYIIALCSKTTFSYRILKLMMIDMTIKDF